MNIAMTIFAMIGIICCGMIGVTLVAIACYWIREKMEDDDE